jgi:Co/Zn/Cd efflux system component
VCESISQLLILPRAFSLLRAVVDGFLEVAQKNVDLDEVREHILGVPQVRNVRSHAARPSVRRHSGIPPLRREQESCFA